METNIIDECSKLSLAGSITFPEVVTRLATIGVERYIADLMGKQKLTYSKEEVYLSGLAFNGPKVANQFDSVKIKEAISNIQLKKINYLTFLHSIMEAGCCHYEVFISGKKAIYFGRDGSYHIENFPGQS